MISFISICVTLLFCYVNLSHQVDPRIVGGVPASINQFPHQVSLRKGNFHFCGGSIIKNDTILTAAHCMFSNGNRVSPNELRVVIGELYIGNSPQVLNTFTVKWITVHANYNASDYHDDLAIIKLNGIIPANHESARPINLTQSSIADDTLCSVSGWGSTVQGGSSSSNLLYASIPIVSPALCEGAYYGTYRAGMICAGHYYTGQVDACQGDSGGPLICDNVLVGVVSFGRGCAQAYSPGVYADVHYYRQWIIENSGTTLNAGLMTVALIIFSIIIN